MFANFTSSVVPTRWFPKEPLIEAASLEPLIEAASREPLMEAASLEPLIEAASREPLTVAELKVLIVDALAPSEPLISVDIWAELLTIVFSSSDSAVVTLEEKLAEWAVLEPLTESLKLSFIRVYPIFADHHFYVYYSWHTKSSDHFLLYELWS